MVGTSLLAALGATTALLSLLSPSPLAPDISHSLFSAAEAPASPEGGGSFDVIFQTGQRLQPGRWKAIYIHHSNTPGGNASTLADSARARGIAGSPDHFVIGNGSGMGDGEIQITTRWSEQSPPAAPAPGVQIDPGCISICLIGDFDQSRPTQAQQQRLAQLVEVLQQRLKLEPGRVIQSAGQDTAGAVGRFFTE